MFGRCLTGGRCGGLVLVVLCAALTCASGCSKTCSDGNGLPTTTPPTNSGAYTDPVTGTKGTMYRCSAYTDPVIGACKPEVLEKPCDRAQAQAVCQCRTHTTSQVCFCYNATNP